MRGCSRLSRLRVAARDARSSVTGRNGSGKTTLLRMLAGLTTPAAGDDPLRGATVAPFDPRLRDARRVHRPSAGAEGRADGEENLASLVALAGATRPARRDRGGARRASRSPRQRALPARVLSQGQRRRDRARAAAAVARPLWILDEPATALDADGIALLAQLLARHLERGGARGRRDASAARPVAGAHVARWRCPDADRWRPPRRRRPRTMPMRARAARRSRGRSRATCGSRCARGRNSACSSCST